MYNTPTMYNTPVDVCNMALAQLNVRPLTGMHDETEESRQCNRLYGYSVAQVLGMADWTFAKVRRELSYIHPASIDPGFITREPMHYFKYPVDAVKLIRVWVAQEREPFMPPPPHKHKKHKHHYTSEDELEDEILETEEDETDEDDDGDEDSTKHHKNHKHPRHLPPGPVHMQPLPFHIHPQFNDDLYELRSIKLKYEPAMVPVIASRFNSVKVEYIRFEENPQYWPPSFMDTVVHYLALQLAPLLSGRSDATEVENQRFLQSLMMAKAINNNERKHTVHQWASIYRGCY